MKQKIQNRYQKTNIRLPLTSRNNFNASSNQEKKLNQQEQTENITTELSSANQNEQLNQNNPLTSQKIIEYSETTEQNEPNKIDENEKIKIRQINAGNINKVLDESSNENSLNVTVPSLINKTNNHKNNSRNGVKFDLNFAQNNIRNKLIERPKDKNHTRAKSYFTERKNLSNYLPSQDESKKRLSHSVEVKRKTIIRGDKYNNIQITHIISVSKSNFDRYNFHIFEKLSTTELKKKPLDLTNIKLYIKNDPNARSFYNSSCRNPPLRSKEKILKTIHYQHAGGRGMTNLKASNLNSKFYQSDIIKIPLREINKKTPSVESVSKFRSECLSANRNASIGGKNNTFQWKK